MSIEFRGYNQHFNANINNIGLYSDGTPMVKVDIEGIAEHADTLVLRPESLAQFTTAMFLVDAIEHSGGWIKKLVLPYLPGARQDRSNPTGDVLFTASSVADMINARRFNKVVSVDPHSEVMPSLINNFVDYPLYFVYDKLWKGYNGVVAPDKGAEHRAEVAGAVLNKPVRYGSKHRDVSTGKLTGFEVEELVPGAHYIVIDDICDGGGTFLGLGEKIREQGCYADLFVTHGIFSKGTDALKKIYKNIDTTDSRHVNDRNDVLTIPVVEDMVNYR